MWGIGWRVGEQEWKWGCPQETRGVSQGEDGGGHQGGNGEEARRRRQCDPRTLRLVMSGDCPWESSCFCLMTVRGTSHPQEKGLGGLGSQILCRLMTSQGLAP